MPAAITTPIAAAAISAYFPTPRSEVPRPAAPNASGANTFPAVENAPNAPLNMPMTFMKLPTPVVSLPMIVSIGPSAATANRQRPMNFFMPGLMLLTAIVIFCIASVIGFRSGPMVSIPMSPRPISAFFRLPFNLASFLGNVSAMVSNAFCVVPFPFRISPRYLL